MYLGTLENRWLQGWSTTRFQCIFSKCTSVVWSCSALTDIRTLRVLSMILFQTSGTIPRRWIFSFNISAYWQVSKLWRRRCDIDHIYYLFWLYATYTVWWSSKKTYKNAITNQLFLLTSALGYLRTKNESYFANANKVRLRLSLRLKRVTLTTVQEWAWRMLSFFVGVFVILILFIGSPSEQFRDA